MQVRGFFEHLQVTHVIELEFFLIDMSSFYSATHTRNFKIYIKNVIHLSGIHTQNFWYVTDMFPGKKGM